MSWKTFVGELTSRNLWLLSPASPASCSKWTFRHTQQRWATVCQNSRFSFQLNPTAAVFSDYHTFKHRAGGRVSPLKCLETGNVKQIVDWYRCFSLLCSFVQGRSSGERSPCVKTRRTLARCWSPLTSETGSRLTACSSVSHHVVQHQANIAHFFNWPVKLFTACGTRIDWNTRFWCLKCSFLCLVIKQT